MTRTWSLRQNFHAQGMIPVVQESDGQYRDVGREHPMPTSLGGNQLDAFSRLRVSNPVTLFASQAQYDDGTTDDYFHKTTTGGSTTHLPDQSSVRMSTDTTAGASVIRQTQRYMRYQPGKSQVVFVTFDFEAAEGGTKRAGYFDAENGVFVELAADGTVYIVNRTNGTGTPSDAKKVAQADWNVDAMDGTGVSGVTLDMTKAQILVIDLQWLATGRIRVGFDIDGILYTAHQFTWSNANSGVYMTTANLPVRYELTGNANATQMQAICASVQSEGGFTADLGHEHITPNITGTSCPTGADTPIVSIRPKALFNSITNRGTYIPNAIEIYTTTEPVQIKLWHGGTLTSPTWVSSDAESGVEYDVSATAITGGHLTGGTYGIAGGVGQTATVSSGVAETLNRIFLTLDIDGNNIDAGNYTITGRGIGGTSVVYCNIVWVEIK